MGNSKETVKSENELFDAVKTIGALFGIGNIQTEVKPGAGWACTLTPQGIRIRIDPLQVARDGQRETARTIEELQIRSEHMLHTAGHEVGHARDILEGGLPYPTNKKDHFFWNTIHDTSIDNHLRLVPLLDSVTDELYQEVLFPEETMNDRPKHVQFMEAILLRTVVPNGKWQFDPEIDQLVEALRNYKVAGGSVDVLDAMAHHETDVRTRVSIARQYIKPIFEALFEEDVENGEADPEDGQEGDEGEDEQNEQDSRPTRRNRQQQENDENEEQDSDDGGEQDDSDENNEDDSDGNESDQDEQDGDSDDDDGDGQDQDPSDQFNDHYDNYEQTMHGGTHHDDDDNGEGQDGDGDGDGDGSGQPRRRMPGMPGLGGGYMIEEEDEGEEDDSDYDDFDGSDLESQLAGTIQKEMKLNKEDSLEYVKVLINYRHIISATADILLKLSSLANAVNAPRYKTIADERGRRIHPSRILEANLQLETDTSQAMWQPLENVSTRNEYIFGGLDMTFIVDVSASMSGDKGKNAGAVAIIMLEAKQLAAERAEQEQMLYNPSDVRSRVLAFGSSTEELAPMLDHTRSVDKGRTFKNLIHPNSSSTLVAGSLEKVQKAAAGNPARDQIVFIITDAIFGDLAKAKEIAAQFTENVYLTQLEMNPSANYEINDKAITKNNYVVRKPEDLVPACLRVLWDYVERFEEL